MSSKGLNPFTQAWHKWKTLRLPWRKRFLAGADLNGNTYWVFRLTNEPGERWRRIVKYPRSTHYSQVKVSPLWHQWLRYTRESPPSLEEQQSDIARQARMKKLAADADARWEAKPRVMDAPIKEQPLPSPRSEPPQAETAQKEAKTETEDVEAGKKKRKEFDPWTQHKARGPSETWQPEAWSPNTNRK